MTRIKPNELMGPCASAEGNGTEKSLALLCHSAPWRQTHRLKGLTGVTLSFAANTSHTFLSPPEKIPSSFQNCLSKGTKLENETEPLTNKITRCLHLVAAIKALMTSEDAILMHRRRCLSFFGPSCRLLSSVTDGFGMCYAETSVIKSASQSVAVASMTPIVRI